MQDDLALEDVEDHSSSFGAHNMAREAIAPASQPTIQLGHFAPVPQTMVSELDWTHNAACCYNVTNQESFARKAMVSKCVCDT